MNLLTKNNALPNIVLLAMVSLASSLPGWVQAQNGIDTGRSTNGTSSGQRATNNFLLHAPSNCLSTDPVAAIARVAGGVAGNNGSGLSCDSDIPNPTYVGTALQQLSNQAAIQVNTTVIASPAETARVVRCLAAKGNGVEEPGCEDVAAAAGRSYAAPARTIAGPFGLSVVVRGDNGKQDTVSGQTGFDSSAAMLTAGLDYRFSDRFVGGVSLSYQHTELDFDLNSGNLKNDAYRLAPFVSYVVAPGLLIDGLVGIGHLHFDSDRTCPNGSCTQFLQNNASFNGTQYFAGAGISKSWTLAEWGMRGYLRGDYVRVNTEDYSESGTRIANSGGTTTALHVLGQNATSLTSTLGWELSRVFSTSTGVVTPRARVEWVHEYKSDIRTLTSEFISAPTVPLRVTTVGPERNSINAGIGAQMNFARSLAGFIDYVHMFRQDARNDALSIGIRYDF